MEIGQATSASSSAGTAGTADRVADGERPAFVSLRRTAPNDAISADPCCLPLASHSLTDAVTDAPPTESAQDRKAKDRTERYGKFKDRRKTTSRV